MGPDRLESLLIGASAVVAVAMGLATVALIGCISLISRIFF